MTPHRPPAGDPLATYRAKRSADRTPEPAGTVPAAPGRLFVVHKHAASHLHYDLRLEMDGVLRSWAVPKGPSRDQADKRLAVHVEDHPIEYGDFEGIIPEGNYGAGAVIVWDRGEWVPVGDWREGLEHGKLLFDLKGYKLKGRWTLVKIKKGQKEWLLIKERDAYLVKSGGDDFEQGSVLSGLKVEELKSGVRRGDALAARLAAHQAPRRVMKIRDVDLMLCETRAAPFTKDGWLFELKLDGWRMLAAREGERAVLRSRNGHDLTATFPEIARSVARLSAEGVVIDGEVVVPDARGLPSFQLLQQRARLSRPLDVRHAAVELPATLFCFDLLGAEGHDLRGLPVATRKELLGTLLPAAGPLRLLEHFERDGDALFAQVQQMGLEGIIAKRADSTYRGGRSPAWLKIKTDPTDDFVVVGFTRPKGSRTGFGALHVAQFDGKALVYAGRVGTGFDEEQLAAVRDALEAATRPDPPCTGPVPRGKDNIWIAPSVVVELRFREWTKDELLRHPVFVRFRGDKQAEECVRQGNREWAIGNSEDKDADAVRRAQAPERRPAQTAPFPIPHSLLPVFTNLDKVFWKAEGYTKGDLIAYYRAIAPWMMPYLRDRPLVLTRYPDGIEGKSFFQKDAPAYAHDFVRIERMWSAASERELNYFVCDDEHALLYIANMAAIPLHIWGSRCASLEHPDWCILDLDPKEAPFAHVIEVARACKALCDDIQMPCYVKTSGSTGLHVLLPMGRQVTFDQARTLGGLLARCVANELPDIATVTRQVTQRDGRVYLDYVQNGHGRLLAAPFSVRPVPGALVSATLEWKEVTAKLSLADYTIQSVPRRMKRRKQDPMRPVLEERPDLTGALERLHARYARTARR